jgi:hypothetical protein
MAERTYSPPCPQSGYQSMAARPIASTDTCDVYDQSCRCYQEASHNTAHVIKCFILIQSMIIDAGTHESRGFWGSRSALVLRGTFFQSLLLSLPNQFPLFWGQPRYGRLPGLVVSPCFWRHVFPKPPDVASKSIPIVLGSAAIRPVILQTSDTAFWDAVACP